MRIDALDAEVAASGVTKQMEKDILAELGEDDSDDDDEDSDEDDDDEDNPDVPNSDEDEAIIEEIVDQKTIEDMRKELEASVNFAETPSSGMTT